MNIPRFDTRRIILMLVAVSMFLLKFFMTDLYQSVEQALLLTGVVAAVVSFLVWRFLKRFGGVQFIFVLAVVGGALLGGYGASVAVKGTQAKRAMYEDYKSKDSQGVNQGNDLPRHVVDALKRARTSFEDQWRNLNPGKVADPTMIKSFDEDSLKATIAQGLKLVAEYQAELGRITTEYSSEIRLLAMTREILFKYTHANESLLRLWRRKIILLKQYEQNWVYENGKVVFRYAQDRVTPLPGYGEYQNLRAEIDEAEGRLQHVSREYYTLFN